ncbi:hypothetical protein B9037_006245 [Klebsiella aerogenes]|nr:hypothetical protein B9037_006245 [Klebsiella aerogenes]
MRRVERISCLMCYQNVAIFVLNVEKMKILHSAICATGIDWSRYFTDTLKVFYDTTAPSQIPPRLPCAGLSD